jgi:phage baseplate assembly protein W
MRPEYGTIIWDLLMDPSDPSTEKEIRQDISRIVNADPRVEALGVDIFIMDHVIRVEISLNYVLLNTQDILYLEYIDDIKGTEF